MRSNFFPILFFCLFLVACTDTEYKKHIVGQWSGTEWLTEGRPSGNNASDAYFSFADKTYTYRYGSHEEKGKYFISNNQLHTTPEGGITMMVKIVRLNEDSLVFDMNRGGQAEQLTLVRQ